MSSYSFRSRAKSAPASTADFNQWWENFAVEKISTVGDGEESCSAFLEYIPRTRWEKSVFFGATGSGYGHAEMHALHQFVKLQCNYDIETFRAYAEQGIVVTCNEKPCCVRCACVLGALGIRAGEMTYKSTKGMGSTEWSLNYELREFVGKYKEVTPISLQDLGVWTYR